MLILTVILILLSMVFNPKNNSVEAGIHYRGACGILAEPDDTIDMVVVGNSEAYTSIIPMELWKYYGFTSYLCASPEQPLPVSVKLAGESVKHQKPKVIMLEASNIHNTYDLSDASDQILNYVLKVFQYHDRWKHLGKEDFTSKPEYNTVNYMKGYEYANDVNGCEKQSLEKKNDNNPELIPKSNQLYLKMINQICKQNGAKFIIVSVPSYKYWSNEVHEVIKEFCDKNEIEYVDLNTCEDEISIDWKKDTRDNGEHLNYSGAIKVTEYIGKYLNKEKILEDHRNDEKYKHWNEQYNSYKDIVESEI